VAELISTADLKTHSCSFLANYQAICVAKGRQKKHQVVELKAIGGEEVSLPAPSPSPAEADVLVSPGTNSYAQVVGTAMVELGRSMKSNLCRNALTSMNFIAQLNPSSYTGEPERP
jgi:hypothetical protein